MNALESEFGPAAACALPAAVAGGPSWLRVTELSVLAGLPNRLAAASAWSPHVPFLHWTVLTARPRKIVYLGPCRAVAYAALCDAAALLAPPPRCFAVAPLLAADEESEAERAFLRRHPRDYGSNSALLRGGPAEVMQEVGGDIDLLVLDADAHEGEADSLFRTWAGALSPRALVLLHGVRAGDAGAGDRFWRDLAGSHPRLELPFGEGLGLAAVGPDAPPEIGALCAAVPGECDRVRAAFAALGNLWTTMQTLMLTAREHRRREALLEAERAQQIADARREAVDAREGPTPEIERRVRLVRESSLFDADWYLAVNHDVAAAGHDPAWHYVRFGGAEGRSPGPDFDGRWYLDENPDVAAAQIPPLVHWLETGAAEGRPRRRLAGPAAETTMRERHAPPRPGLTPEASARIAHEVAFGLGSASEQAVHLGLHLPRLTVFDVALGIAAGEAGIADLDRLVLTADIALSRVSRRGGGTIFVTDGAAARRVPPPERVAFRRLAPAEPRAFAACHNAMMAEAFAGGAEIYVVASSAIALHPDCLLALVRMVRAANRSAIVEAVGSRTADGKTHDPVTFDTETISAECFAVPRRVHETIGGFAESLEAETAVADYASRAAAAGFALRLCPLATVISAIAPDESEA